MAWRPPPMNMTGSSSTAAANPISATAAAPTPAIFDPNDRVNPFSLHPNESPSLQLVTVHLEGKSNYHAWARAMEMALKSKNKLAFVNGSMLIPNQNDPKHFYWDQCNTMVLSWILRAVSPTIARSVLWINTAEGVWKDLKKRFSQQDIFRVVEIQAEIHQTKQGNTSVNEYFTQLKSLWDELAVLRSIPSCDCIPSYKCGADLSEKVRTHIENDMLTAFLIGLNENFAYTKRQIMLMKPLPDVGEAFAMVSQQERQMDAIPNILTENITGANAFLANSGNNRKFYPNQKPKPVCSYYGYTWHTIDKCYKKHGYPPGWKPRNKSMGSANQVQSSSQESLETGRGISGLGISTVTEEDYRRFLDFMQQQQRSRSTQATPLTINPQINTISANFIPDANLEGKKVSSDLVNSEPLWILDSGATHHILCNEYMLQTSKRVHGIFVDLPNGHQA
ncbi:PREDICTED: uncharacterized protein LOC109184460 [Ipomoea nil]|uniref:uncharacterized protein LOC109184460 n=1 Tax=Ipomoea nil TaxID=35883 RepID=UPI0009016B91|nr:PREDICTED: uncharacterized protein LOC109184460 [Ipomoea nil]